MVDSGFHILSLCSGTAMLDEGIRIAVPGARIVGYVEREAYAAAVLLARMEDQSLEPAPIWCGNLEDFDGRGWHGAVDSITAGFPCQPWSGAGKQQGFDDERWIWPTIAGIIREADPPVVFLENVPGLVSGRGLNRVLGDLAALGFDGEWCAVSAADVGASHLRERIFILAVGAGRGRRVLRESLRWSERFADGRDKLMEHAGREHGELFKRSQRFPESPGTNEYLANAEGSRRREFFAERGAQGRDVAGRSGADVADAEQSGGRGTDEVSCGRESTIIDGCAELADDGSARLQGQREDRSTLQSTGRSGGTDIFAPGPANERWRDILRNFPHLAPAVEPGFRRVVDGHAVVVDHCRADQLRAIGNGVVALSAAVAFRILGERFNK